MTNGSAPPIRVVKAADGRDKLSDAAVALRGTLRELNPTVDFSIEETDEGAQFAVFFSALDPCLVVLTENFQGMWCLIHSDSDVIIASGPTPFDVVHPLDPLWLNRVNNDLSLGSPTRLLEAGRR